MSDDRPLFIDQHWEIITLINSYGLKGINRQLLIYKDIYNKIMANQSCPCNKNHLNFLNSIKDNLNHWLTIEEISLIKEKEEVRVINVKRKDGTILEF